MKKNQSTGFKLGRKTKRIPLKNKSYFNFSISLVVIFMVLALFLIWLLPFSFLVSTGLTVIVLIVSYLLVLRGHRLAHYENYKNIPQGSPV